MDLEHSCRICLELIEEQLDLEVICDEEHQLSFREVLQLLTGIEISEHEKAPQHLCRNCGDELQVCYNFQKKVKVANQILDEMQTSAKQQEAEIEDSFAAESTYADLSYEAALEQDETFYDLRTELLDNTKPENLETAESKRLRAEIDYEFLDEEESIETEDKETVSNRYEDQRAISSPTINANDDVVFVQYLIEEVENYADEAKPSKATDISEIIEESPTTENESIAITAEKPSRQEFECDFCHKIFTNLSRLMLHRNCHDPDRPRFPCKDCSRVYATKQAMETHAKIMHEKKGFPCTWCKKIFAIRKGLEIHMRYHTGHFPFACDQCDRKFAQLCHLNTHIKVKHHNARFTCEYPNCNKFFTNSASLRNHEFTHGNMPFICSFCENGYPAKAKLKVHIRRKHGHEMTTEDLERMRRFHVSRTRLKMVQLTPNTNEPITENHAQFNDDNTI